MQSTRGCGPRGPGDEQPPPKGLPLLDLAPGGGYLAADIAARAGGLLHHLFTLTLSPPPIHWMEGGLEGAVCFCGPIRQVAPSRVLPGALLYGVRTFLDGTQPPRSSGQPGVKLSYPFVRKKSILLIPSLFIPPEPTLF